MLLQLNILASGIYPAISPGLLRHLSVGDQQAFALY